MCFGSHSIPAPPPQPLPPSPRQAGLDAQADSVRRARSAIAPRSSTVITSASGDPDYQKNVQTTKLMA